MDYSEFFVAIFRPIHNSLTGVSKVDMSEDIEPTLSKLDVVLTFSIEVSQHVNVLKASFLINYAHFSIPQRGDVDFCRSTKR